MKRGSRRAGAQTRPTMAVVAAALLLCLPIPASAQPARIKAILSRVDPARIKQDVEDLAGLGTRFCTSPQASQAAAMLQKKLEQAGLTSTLQPFMLPGVQANNVVVTLSGSLPNLPLVVASAHYDSIAFDATDGLAPGAEDNGSGVAGLLAMARALAAEKLAAGVMLVFFAAEEVGLVGSNHMVAELKGQGKLSGVLAVLNMDMIGYDPGQTRLMLVDGFQGSRSLAGRIQAAALAYTGVRVAADIYSPGRSDHAPFAREGIPAVNLAAASWREYPHYHTNLDTPEHVDPKMVAEVARANLATTLRLTGFADGPPVARAGAFVSAVVGDRVTFDAGQSFDPAGKGLTFKWARLDGPAATVQQDGARLTFTPGEQGVHRYQVTVSSADGRVSEPDIVAAIVEEAGGCAVAGRAGAWPWAAVCCLLLWGRIRRQGSSAPRTRRASGAPPRPGVRG